MNDSTRYDGGQAERAPIPRSQGVTPAERYLQQLCERSFLRLWSYAGLFRDQGIANTREGKEVCDLLVVFENRVVMFSDKLCEFPRTGNLELDWCRWFRRAIARSADQVWGAERWLRQHPQRLFLDRACKTRIPIPIPADDQTVFHRIVVAHGGAERCREHFGGGSGSFVLMPSLSGTAHYDRRAAAATIGAVKPFTIGDLDPSRGFVHVFDDASLDMVMRTLDTLPDLVAYLEKKERFFRSGRLGWAAGEEDLMAFYLKYVNEQDEHDFVVPSEVAAVAIEEGHYMNFLSCPERRAQVAANHISYSWDALLEKFIGHSLGATQHYTTSANLVDDERMYRFMAREPRTRRRMLSRALHEILEQATSERRRARIVQPSSPGDPFYVFLGFAPRQDRSYEDYRVLRRELLVRYAMAVKVKFADASDIIGIATEPASYGDDRSEDLVYMDGRNWTDREWEEARHWQTELHLFEEMRMYSATEQEYPVERIGVQIRDFRAPGPKNRRNMPCGCGSGKKFKKCCGRPT